MQAQEHAAPATAIRTPKVCEVCGEPFTPARHNEAKARFCSTKCRLAHFNEMNPRVTKEEYEALLRLKEKYGTLQALLNDMV